MELKDTKELLALGLTLGNAIGSAMEDGQIDVTDLTQFIQVIPKVSPAVLGLENVDDEIKAAKEKDWQGLVDYAKEEFDIPQDKIEHAVETALDVAMKIVHLVEMFKAD